MNIQQLRALQEVVRHDFNLTMASQYLNSTQPGLSRHLQLLEQELGVELFVKRKRRFINLSPAGEALLPIVERALGNIEELRRTAGQFAAGAAGSVTIATRHTYALYMLPALIERFKLEYPHAQIRLRQGNRTEVAALVNAGEADFSVAVRPVEPFPEMEFLPCFEIQRCILVPQGHPLLRQKTISLDDVARYPIVTYDRESTFGAQVFVAFEEKGLHPTIVLTSTDAELMKTYVRSGLGIGIISHTAFQKKSDRELRVIDARHLFQSEWVSYRRSAARTSE